MPGGVSPNNRGMRGEMAGGEPDSINRHQLQMIMGQQQEKFEQLMKQIKSLEDENNSMKHKYKKYKTYWVKNMHQATAERRDSLNSQNNNNIFEALGIQ